MLKKISWVVAALFVALAMIFAGCTEMAKDLDDGSGPVPDADLVIEGDDIVLGKMGSNQTAITIDGAKFTFKDASATSVGVYYEFPKEAKQYPNVVIYFKVLSVRAGRPGLLIKNRDMTNYTGILNDQDPAYQLNDVGLAGTEFNTGTKPTAAFKDGQIGFQHQAWNPAPGNGNVDYTVEVTKVVFPGKGAGEIINYRTPTVQSDPKEDDYEPNFDKMFYVNLNNLKAGVAIPNDDAAQAVPADAVASTVATDKVTLNFTKRNQRAFFELSDEQVALLEEADKVNITVTATKDTGTFTFRYGLADSALTGNWNATSLPTSIGTKESATFARKTGNTLKYFMIQSRDDGTATKLEIKSILIEAVLKDFTGDLTILGGPDADDPTIAAADYTLPATLMALYDGLETGYTLTWARNGITAGTGPVLISAFGGMYEVTMSKYGYYPLSADLLYCGCWINEDSDDCICPPTECQCPACMVEANIIFAGTADPDKGQVKVAAELAGSATGLAGDGVAPVLAVETDGSGFTFTYGKNGATPNDYRYGAAYVIFPVTFPANGYALSKFSKISFYIEGLAGDTGWKQVVLLASNTKITGSQSDGAGNTLKIAANVATGDTRPIEPGQGGGNQVYTASIDATYAATLDTTQPIWFCIFMNCGGDQSSYKIADVRFHN